MYEREQVINMYQDVVKERGYRMELNVKEPCINVIYQDQKKRCLSIWLKQHDEVDVVFRPAVYDKCIEKMELPQIRRNHNNQYHIRMPFEKFDELMHVLTEVDA